MRWVLVLVAAVFAAALSVGTVNAQKRGGDPKLAARKNPVPSTPASITAGRALYNKNCRHCHGLRGKGDGPLAPKDPKPADLTDAKWDHGSSDGEIFAVIWNGAPSAQGKAKDAGMVGMKGTLTEKDVWQIVDYIRSIGPAGAAKPAPATPASTKTTKKAGAK
jgi:mono/diheme cytochrome c family protein